MATRPNSLTLFDRATPEQRAEIRRKSLAMPCPDCKARTHETCRGISGKPSKPHLARQINGGARPVPTKPKTAAEEALDEIAALCGCPEWEYPGQVIRDVRLLRERLEAVIGKSAERLALDMDHADKDHSAWWKAVERARRFIAKKGARK